MRTIKPDWPAPDSIVAFSTTREGGHSQGVYRGLNIALHVGDDSDVVMLNRQMLVEELPVGTSIQWLLQVHGHKVVPADNRGETPRADASWAAVPGVACAVMTADCLPVLFCTKDGEKVAAAHAGWRGLAQGVLEACVEAMKTDVSEVMAWLGPAIGPDSFEVGEEVRDQFLSNSASAQRSAVHRCFKGLSDRPGFYLADLYALARIRLNAAGISDIYGGGHCTFADKTRFYSYRRDGETGRMATVITKTPPLD